MRKKNHVHKRQRREWVWKNKNEDWEPHTHFHSAFIMSIPNHLMTLMKLTTKTNMINRFQFSGFTLVILLILGITMTMLHKLWGLLIY